MLSLKYYQRLEFHELNLLNKYIDLSNTELQLFKEVISSTYSKIYLSEVKLNVFYLKDALNIIGLLPDYMNIEEIEIKYKNSSSKEIRNPEEAIWQAKSKFHKKLLISNKVDISHF